MQSGQTDNVVVDEVLQATWPVVDRDLSIEVEHVVNPLNEEGIILGEDSKIYTDIDKFPQKFRQIHHDLLWSDVGTPLQKREPVKKFVQRHFGDCGDDKDEFDKCVEAYFALAMELRTEIMNFVDGYLGAMFSSIAGMLMNMTHYDTVMEQWERVFSFNDLVNSYMTDWSDSNTRLLFYVLCVHKQQSVSFESDLEAFVMCRLGICYDSEYMQSVKKMKKEGQAGPKHKTCVWKIIAWRMKKLRTKFSDRKKRTFHLGKKGLLGGPEKDWEASAIAFLENNPIKQKLSDNIIDKWANEKMNRYVTLRCCSSVKFKTILTFNLFFVIWCYYWYTVVFIGASFSIIGVAMMNMG